MSFDTHHHDRTGRLDQLKPLNRSSAIYKPLINSSHRISSPRSHAEVRDPLETDDTSTLRHTKQIQRHTGRYGNFGSSQRQAERTDKLSSLTFWRSSRVH